MDSVKPWCFTAFIFLMITLVQLSPPECPIDLHLCRPNENKRSNPHIIGGEPAVPHEFPWMVLLTMFPEINGKYELKEYCGGILVDDDLVLTAAHCIYNFYDNGKSKACHDAFVTSGEHDRCRCTEETQYINTETVYIHPDFKWDGPASLNDIALIKLNQSFKINDFTKPLNLSESFETSEDEDEFFTVAGWGTTTNDDEHKVGSIQLQKVNVTKLDASECIKHDSNFKDDLQVCVSGEDHDACEGDSGGPLLVTRGNVTTLYGIISRKADTNKKCGETPGFYTRVSAYKDILEKIQSKREEADGFQLCASCNLGINFNLYIFLAVICLSRSVIL